MTIAALVSQAIPEKNIQTFKFALDNYFGPTLDNDIQREPDKRVSLIGKQIKSFHLSFTTGQLIELNFYLNQANIQNSDVINALVESTENYSHGPTFSITPLSNNPLLAKLMGHYIKGIAKSIDNVMTRIQMGQIMQNNPTFVKEGLSLPEYIGKKLSKVIYRKEIRNSVTELCIYLFRKDRSNEALVLLESLDNAKTIRKTHENAKRDYPDFAATLLTNFPAQINVATETPEVDKDPVDLPPLEERFSSGNSLKIVSIITFAICLLGTLPVAVFALLFSPWLALTLLVGGAILTIGSLALAIIL